MKKLIPTLSLLGLFAVFGCSSTEEKKEVATTPPSDTMTTTSSSTTSTAPALSDTDADLGSSSSGRGR